MATLSELMEGVRNNGFDSMQDSKIELAVTRADRRIRSLRRWRFLRYTTTLSTVAASQQVSTASITDLRAIESVRLVDPTYGDNLTPISFQDYKNLSLSGSDATGLPRFWTEGNGQILVWPTPQAVYSLSVDYIGTGTDMVSPTDVSDIPDPYSEVIEWSATAALAARERDTALQQIAKVEYAERLVELRNQHELGQRQSSLTVQESGFFNEWI